MLLPARLIYIVIMRIPEPTPLGLTFLLAMMRATALASLVKVPSGGNVETVLILCDHLRFVFFLAMAKSGIGSRRQLGNRRHILEGAGKADVLALLDWMLAVRLQRRVDQRIDPFVQRNVVAPLGEMLESVQHDFLDEVADLHAAAHLGLGVGITLQP